MSVVVRRCPNCGSVQEDPGTCETCHEAEVRYICENHSPGRWLDAPACPECGATVRAGPTRGVPPARPTRAATPPPIPPAPPRRTTARPTPPPTRRAEPTYEAPYDPPYAPPPPRAPAPVRPPLPSLPELLRRAREAAGERAGRPMDPRSLPPAVRVGLPSVVGCVGRLIMLVLVLLALAAAAFSYVVWY